MLCLQCVRTVWNTCANSFNLMTTQRNRFDYCSHFEIRNLEKEVKEKTPRVISELGLEPRQSGSMVYAPKHYIIMSSFRFLVFKKVFFCMYHSATNNSLVVISAMYSTLFLNPLWVSTYLIFTTTLWDRCPYHSILYLREQAQRG